MMKKLVANLVGTTLCLSMLGCATIADTSTNLGKQMGITNTEGAAAAGGATIGCIGGAAVAYMMGNSMAKGCGVGAVAIGSVAAITVYQQQLDEAKQIATQMQGTAYNVVLTEKPAPRPENQTASAEQAPPTRLDTMTLDLPKKSVDTKDPQVTVITRKLALVAIKNPKGAVITVEGTKPRRDYLTTLINRSLPPESQKTVKVESKASTVNTRVTLVSLG